MTVHSRLTFTLFHLLLFLAQARSQESSGVTFLGNQNLYPAIGYNDCWGYTDSAGREYALLGVRTGLSIVDITDAPTLKEVGFVPNPGGVSVAMDIKTYRHYAYVASENDSGLNIVDLSGLPNSATLAATFKGLPSSHNIYIDTSSARLFAQYHGVTGVLIFSLTNPLHPVLVDSFGTQCHDVYVRDSLAYVSEGYLGTYGIYNLDVSPPALVRTIPAPPDGGFAHNAWLTEEGTHLAVTYEDAGRTVKLWNISSPDTVYVEGNYLGPSGLAHNVLVKGNFAYVAHYTDGLRILDITSKADPSQIAFYDSYPSGGTGFHGAWGVFPFFASGKVLISDIESGLHVVQFLPPVTAIERPVAGLGWVLRQNHPNPFNPTTVIGYQLSTVSEVRLSVFDVLGREVAVLADGSKGPGFHEIQWGASAMASGMYFYRLVAGERVETRRMVLIR